MGEANVGGEACLTGGDPSINQVIFHTRESGRVELRRIEEMGRVKTRQEGGTIALERH
jgi:hypothetical protein